MHRTGFLRVPAGDDSPPVHRSMRSSARAVSVKAPALEEKTGAPTGPSSSRNRIRGLARAAHLTGRRVLGVLGLGVTLVGLYHFYWPIVSGPPPQPPLSGDLNVGVAQFAAAPGTQESYAQALSDSVFSAVRDDLRTLRHRSVRVEVRVAGPARVGAVDGDDADDRLQAAQRLTRDLDVHVLLYGVLDASDDAVELRPEFAFAEPEFAFAKPTRDPEARQPLLSAVQLPPSPTAGHSIGVIREPSAAAAGVTARARVRERVVSLARAFASFTLGLSFYSRALELQAVGAPAGVDLRDAARWFRVAGSAGLDRRDSHVIQLLQGNIALLQGEMDLAARHYRRALRSGSGGDSTPAQLGIAETRFHQASANCTAPRIAGTGLRESIKHYRAVLASLDARPSVLRAKAQFGLGRAALRAAYATGDWATPEREWRAVTTAYDNGYRDIRLQAAAAFGGLGLLVMLRGDTSRPRMRVATGDLERAIELTPPSPAQGSLFSLLGSLRAQLGERSAARTAYREAIRLDSANRRAYEAESEQLTGD